MTRFPILTSLVIAVVASGCRSRTDSETESASQPTSVPSQACPEIQSTAEAVEAAIAAAEKWLKLVDEGHYPQSWEAAAVYFKRAVTKERWQQALRGVRMPLGRALSRKLRSKQYRTSLPGAPDGQYVVIQYETRFENKRSSIETVTPMRDIDGTWRVSGYYIK